MAKVLVLWMRYRYSTMQCPHLFSLSHLLNYFGITIERLIFSEIHQTWRTLRKSLPQRWSGSREPSRSHRHRRTPPSPPPPSPPRARRTWWRRWTGSPWSGATLARRRRRRRRRLNSGSALSLRNESLIYKLCFKIQAYHISCNNFYTKIHFIKVIILSVL